MCEHGSSSSSFPQHVSDPCVLADLLSRMYVSVLRHLRDILSKIVELQNLRHPHVTSKVTPDFIILIFGDATDLKQVI